MASKSCAGESTGREVSVHFRCLRKRRIATMNGSTAEYIPDLDHVYDMHIRSHLQVNCGCLSAAPANMK